MKYLLLFVLFSFGFQNDVQNNEPPNITVVNFGGSEKCFHIQGEYASTFLNALFANNQKVKRRGYTHKFKNIKAQGITENLQLKVHEGIHGVYEENKCCSYFNTFDNEKYKKERISRMTENEEFGIIIYVKKKGNEKIQSQEEAELFVKYIETLK